MGTGGVNQAAQTQAVSAYEQTNTKTQELGKTIGEPKLSEKAQKYYDQLKQKFGNMDFILVSKDMKETAKANVAQYANANKTVVLIDEEKIERMASDEEYRKKYEGIISGATAQLEQMKNQMGSSASNVKTYGIKINDGGNASFFAVIDKSLAAQKERIQKKAKEKAEEKKKSEKEARDEKLEEYRTGKQDKADRIAKKESKDYWSRNEEDYVTVTAGSIEELVKKIDDTVYAVMSDNVETETEKMIGRNIDFSA
ncbi:MAG: DUF6033 family protein [Thermoflexaceae bacterium]|nr:DUF6033 family protein [Thermoflexaceae bacterium]